VSAGAFGSADAFVGAGVFASADFFAPAAFGVVFFDIRSPLPIG
jgi:hypothetical protein